MPKDDLKGKWKTRNGSEAEVLDFLDEHWVGKVKSNNQDIYGVWNTFGDSKIAKDFDLMNKIQPDDIYKSTNC